MPDLSPKRRYKKGGAPGGPLPGQDAQSALVRTQRLEQRIQATEAQLLTATQGGEEHEVNRLKGLLAADRRALRWWQAKT